MKNEHAAAFVPQAVEYLTAQKKEKFSGARENAVAGAVADALIGFCNQDAEFAQAVAQTQKFAACLAAVCKGVGNSISDIEVYRRAAAFYFPGAKIDFKMTIDLIGDAAEPSAPSAPKKRLELAFTDLL